jgi:hypothetical protein
VLITTKPVQRAARIHTYSMAKPHAQILGCSSRESANAATYGNVSRDKESLSGVISRPISTGRTAVSGGTPSPVTSYPVYLDVDECQEIPKTLSLAGR